MIIETGNLNIVNIQKSILYEYVDPEAFPLESTGLIFRGIGQKELDFIRAHDYIASKGIGNDADQEATTCFSQLYSQAEGYARSNYDLYNEKQAYVIAVMPPMTAVENELGEVEVVGKLPSSSIVAVLPIDQLNKSITRADAKKVHDKLPEGGQWRTMNGHHIYIKDGKVLAGAVPAVKGGAKKATKAQLAEHQANIDKETKKAGTGGLLKRKDLQKKASTVKKPASKKTASTPKKTTPKPETKLPEKSTANYNSKFTMPEMRDKCREYAKHIVDNVKDKDAFTKYLVNTTGNEMHKFSMKNIEWAAKATDAQYKAIGKENLLKQLKALQENYNHCIDYQKATAKQQKAAKPTAKARKDIDDIANSRPKEAKKKATSPKDRKKDVEDILKKPNPKAKPGKSATKKDLDKLAAENKKAEEAKKKRTPKPPTKEDLDEMFGAPNKKPINSRFKKVQEAGTSTGEKIPPKPNGVKDIRSEKQTNHDVAYDVGNKIGGARKDQAAIKAATDKLLSDSTGQSLDKLEAMSPELAQKYCIKKNLINPVDFKAEFDRGADINMAMCKQLIYDRIAPQPAGDTPKDRQLYLSAIRSLESILEPIKTWDDMKKTIYDLRPRMKRELPDYMHEQEKYLDYAEKEAAKEPTEANLKQYNYKEGTWTTLIPKEWKAKKLQRVQDVKAEMARVEEAKKAPFAPLGDKIMKFFTDSDSANRTLKTVYSKKLNWDNYFKKPAEGEDKPKGPSKNTVKWERVMPAQITRTGGRATPVKKPEDMVKNFGFKGVEFGNYVDDKSGNFHLIKCAEAFQDLADILGVKDKDVSLNGTLSMAFGARGKGAALAHYEPVAKAINITKNGGAGTLAHEWGHALDNLMYQESAGHSSLNYASEGMADEGSAKVKAAYKDAMQAIMLGDGLDSVENKHKTYYNYHPAFKKAVEELGLSGAIKKSTEIINSKYSLHREYLNTLRAHYGDATIDKRIDSEERKRKRDISDMVQEMAYHHEKATGQKIDNIPVYTGHSQYYIDSSKQGGKDNKYWISGREMFARAFENYIEGKMKSGPVKNDYLVHGTYAGSGIPGCPAPYPKGTEREAIHKAFDKLVAAIRESDAIQKALSLMDLVKGNLGQELEPGSSRFWNKEDMDARIDQSNRCAYNVADTNGVIWIPVNRLQCPYQTEKALNFDKIQENVERMQNGENLEPIVIGLDHDLLDGHHRLEASKIMSYTHVPCIVGTFNDITRQRANEMYGEIWKALKIVNQK